jgi:hypothetical protein
MVKEYAASTIYLPQIQQEEKSEATDRSLFHLVFDAWPFLE